ncbi:MAG TPA: helix-turn-helix transcriptional regulator [Armatimonadaceae bacterium]|nr:helix-turn-helix transcriptional regulator [Armatimonadaceae bacterium]
MLQQYRERAGLGIAEAAAMVRVSPSYLAAVERGSSRCPYSLARRLVTLYTRRGVPCRIDDFLFRKER